MKQFLKPDWRKILVFLILLSIAIFLPINYIYSTCPIFGLLKPEAKILPCDGVSEWKFVLLIELVGGRVLIGLGYLVLILEIVGFYLISCFIFWLWDKRKRTQI